MSLITRCSACGTMFKVVADQLRISQGWVRCGHCSEVFDAAAHLQPFEAAGVVDPGSANDTQVPTHGQQAAPVFGPAPTPPVVQAPAPDTAAAVVVDIPASPPSMPEIQVSLPPEMAADVFASSVNPEPSDLPASEPQKPVRESVFVESEAPDSSHDVSFVRDARRNAFWRGRGVRSSLVLAAAVLFAVLLVQLAQFQRNALAAWLPSLSPALHALCAQLDCKLEPAKQIESVLIDSSSFNKIAADAYRLKVVIKNAGAIALAMPSLELTLTDTQDQTLLRRVLAPHEFGATDGVLAAGAEFSGVVALKVAHPVSGPSPAATSAPKPTGALRIAGYRVLAFYP